MFPQDDIMLPGRVRLQHEASLLRTNAVGSPPVLLSFSCPSPLLFLPLLHCLPHHLRRPSPEKIKNIPGVGFGVCCCARASLARRAVRVSGVDAFSGAPGQRSEVVCAREARETGWRQQACRPGANNPPLSVTAPALFGPLHKILEPLCFCGVFCATV